MELEKIKITDIKEAEYNPRIMTENEMTKLENSINEFGLADPIIINLKNNKIIGGHQRYNAILNKYYEEGDFQPELNLIRLGDVGWVFTDTDITIKDEDHEKALNLALNKISGDWEYEKLNTVLDDLSSDGFDVDLTGFSNLEVTEIQLGGNIEYEQESFEDEDIEDIYEEPEKDKYQCPNCHFVDDVSKFKKIN